MKPLSLRTIADWCGGRLASGDPDAMASSVSTDTRTICQGSLFVALAGERFDAHEFAGAAAAAGAVAVVASRPVTVPAGVGVILADDTLTALQHLGAAWRRAWGGAVVGLTGSNGKTSTKDLTRAVLARAFRTAATSGNLNNHIGVPLTLLSIDPEHEAAVVEMGMNHSGEIAPLAAIAAPQIGIITNIGTAHIENLGSREAIALEKGALAEAVPADGTVILNAGDDFTPSIAARCRARVLTAGIEAGDVRVAGLTSGHDGSRFRLTFPDGTGADVHLPLPGRHMAGNAALAAAAGWVRGLDAETIAAGLAEVTLTHGRVQRRTVAGLSFLDDSYNANPDSMAAAFETLRSLECRGRRIAVLGRMGELGAHSAEGHQRTGAAAHAAGVDLLLLLDTGDVPLIAEGFLAAGGAAAAVHLFPDAASCAAHLRAVAGPDDLILLKASRSAAIERVAAALTES